MKNYQKKILNLNQLKKRIFLEKNKNRTIVHCHGVFDLIHVGHVKHFNSAKKVADFLIVSITADKFVNKGPGRPVFNHFLRAEVISSIESVDAVFINENKLPSKLIEIIKPNFYFKGPDYKELVKDKSKDINKDILSVKKIGGKVIFSKDITFSSSKLIKNHFDLLDPLQKKFLNKISKNYNISMIDKYFEKIKSLSIFLIGETIIDQYVFGDTLGKSGKETHLVMRQDTIERYLGGAATIANHLSSFCKKIKFLTMIGENKDFLNFIKKFLKKNVFASYVFKKDSPTIIKTRFIDKITNNKLLGVYQINEKKLDEDFEKYIQKLIKKNAIDCDLILISDYGHSLISSKTAKILQSQNSFIALNAQINASNYGYHSLRKYKKISTLIINENELRHEMRDKISDCNLLARKLANIHGIKNLVVTKGKNGALLLKNGRKLFKCPSFANKVIDRVGAGDAMLAVISLCLKVKMPEDLALFFGCLAGSTVVEHIGNSKFIDKSELLKQVEHLIK